MIQLCSESARRFENCATTPLSFFLSLPFVFSSLPPFLFFFSFFLFFFNTNWPTRWPEEFLSVTFLKLLPDLGSLGLLVLSADLKSCFGWESQGQEGKE